MRLRGNVAAVTAFLKQPGLPKQPRSIWYSKMTYVDLNRHFRDLTEKELDDPDFLASLNQWKYATPNDWKNILQYRRVLLIAEAGSGKTEEMQFQTRRLADAGSAAFFLPLESLDRQPLTDLLTLPEQARFDAWLRTESDPAWFFLDAVDELKLTDGKLDRALRSFSRAIDGRQGQSHIVLSCRPLDWRPDVDLATYLKHLPVPSRELKPDDPDAIFLSAIDEEMKQEAKENVVVNDSAVKTVILLPLSDQQIKAFVSHLGVKDSDALVAEIARRDAWSFARRPLDLMELANTWRNLGRLGTRTEQHGENVRLKLQDDPDRPDFNVLSDDKALVGAERLALALALTRTRTIRAPEQSTAVSNREGVLDPRDILPEWRDDERRTLLRRALFDPATYGRVRFHHRSVQEYLASRHLKRMREAGMSTKAVSRLLFGEKYGEQLVLPSMRPIAAWLSLWDDAVRKTLTAREPEALLTEGDPESLNVPARVDILKSFAAHYGQGGWRGLNVPTEEVRRLAHPILGDTIRNLWVSCQQQADVGELLVELIWQGAIRSCSDLAFAKAMDESAPYDHRVIAVRALVACGDSKAITAVAVDLVANTQRWPIKAVHILIADLFPVALSVDELISLLDSVREDELPVGGFSWGMKLIVDQMDPRNSLAIELRDRLAALIWSGRNQTQEFFRILGRFNFLSPALGCLCLRQLGSGFIVDEALARACVIASRFAPADGSALNESNENRLALTASLKAGREIVFWTESDVMHALVPTEPADQRFFYAIHDGLVSQFLSADRTWLMKALSNKSNPSHRILAQRALLELYLSSGKPIDLLIDMRDAISDDAELLERIANVDAPLVPNPQMEALERNSRRHRVLAEGRKRKVVADWKKWREELLSSPGVCFGPERVQTTLLNIYKWLTNLPGSSNYYNVWNSEMVRRAFGTEVARLAQIALAEQWRKERPHLASERAPEQLNSMPYSWIIGLCGVSAEAMCAGWSDTITPEDAETATRYATIEINGLAPFITDLARTHPDVVKTVIGNELTNQLKKSDEVGHVGMLQDVGHADQTVKALISDCLLNEVRRWPTDGEGNQLTRRVSHLHSALGILSDVLFDEDRAVAGDICQAAFEARPHGPFSLVWLRGLFRFNSQRATDCLLDVLSERNDTDPRALEIFANLFGDYGGPGLLIDDDNLRVRVLGKLVRAAYRLIRLKDDNQHEGSFEPDVRDRGQRGRETLLAQLINTPGPVAQAEMLSLANEPDFADFPDRLRLLARRRAAIDAEFPAFQAEQVRQMEKQHEAPPRDREGLFHIMQDRLEDLAYLLAEDDFSDRAIVQAIENEADMQRTLALRLKLTSNSAYHLSRENETINSKRTDIHFSTVMDDCKGVVEIKIGDNKWTIPDLEHALRTQLVRDYMRDANRKAGILLITYAGRRRHWKDPNTGTPVSFEDLLDRLQEVAREIVRTNPEEISLAVMGLDLR